MLNERIALCCKQPYNCSSWNFFPQIAYGLHKYYDRSLPLWHHLLINIIFFALHMFHKPISSVIHLLTHTYMYAQMHSQSAWVMNLNWTQLNWPHQPFARSTQQAVGCFNAYFPHFSLLYFVYSSSGYERLHICIYTYKHMYVLQKYEVWRLYSYLLSHVEREFWTAHSLFIIFVHFFIYIYVFTYSSWTIYYLSVYTSVCNLLTKLNHKCVKKNCIFSTRAG